MRRCLSALFVLSLAVASAAGDVPLRIVTFNTYQGIDNASADRAASGNLLTSLDLDGPGPNTSLMPDIVCLQETTSLNDLEDFRDDFLPGYEVLKGPTTDGFYSNGFFVRGDLSVLKFDEFGTPGPRPVLRLIVGVPTTPEYVLIYNAHFKAGQSGDDVDTRRAEANAIANRVAVDRELGIDVDGNGTKEFFPTHYFFAGDLNQDDFGGDVINALLEGGSNGLPTGLNDVRVETLYGAQFPTFLGDTYSTRTSLSRRYDYVLVSDEIFATFDANADQIVDQDELNEAGFVYISGDDGGHQASGDVDATTVASDHAPVVVDFSVPGIPGDLDGDGDVDLADLAALLSNYGTPSGANPEDGDLDGDGDVDLSDLAALLANYGTGR
jgi:endonuclease/exonuclease/phosphatase family metal-dependent hydrolase